MFKNMGSLSSLYTVPISNALPTLNSGHTVAQEIGTSLSSQQTVVLAPESDFDVSGSSYVEMGTSLWAEPIRMQDDRIPMHPDDFQHMIDYLKRPDDFSDWQRELFLKHLQGTFSGHTDLEQFIPDDDTDEVTDPEFNQRILSPLETVFLNDNMIDRALVALGIPELLEGDELVNSGCILNGPPGTGKTVLVRAIGEIYKNMGAYSTEINLAQFNQGIVGSLAKNLDKAILKALKEARKRGRPSLIYLDEATVLVAKIVEGSNVKNYYQASLDVLKKYIGNYPELVFAISTNGLAKDFDAALVRDGRLEVITVEYPEFPEKVRMWEHFLREYDVIHDLEPDQYRQLADAFPKTSQGAAIVSFAQGVLKKLAMEKLRAEGYPNLLQILKAGISLGAVADEIRSEITFEHLLEQAKVAQVSTLAPVPQRKQIGGFFRDRLQKAS